MGAVMIRPCSTGKHEAISDKRFLDSDISTEKWIRAGWMKHPAW